VVKPSNTDVALEWLAFRLPFSARKKYDSLIAKYLGDVHTVLDVGCGQGLYHSYKKYETTGIDIYEDDLAKAKELGNYTKLVCGDVRELPFDAKSFDAVTAFEIIEHLKKDEGIKLLDSIENIARKRVVVSTPWGNDLSPKDKWNPFMEHQSGWFPKEFTERGYKIYPVLRIRMNFKQNLFTKVVFYGLNIFASPIIALKPEKWCNGFIAVKEIM